MGSAPSMKNSSTLVPISMRSPDSRTWRGFLTPLMLVPLAPPRSVSTASFSVRSIWKCRRDTAGSASTMLQSRPRPTRCLPSGTRWILPRSGPETARSSIGVVALLGRRIAASADVSIARVAASASAASNTRVDWSSSSSCRGIGGGAAGLATGRGPCGAAVAGCIGRGIGRGMGALAGDGDGLGACGKSSNRIARVASIGSSSSSRCGGGGFPPRRSSFAMVPFTR